MSHSSGEGSAVSELLLYQGDAKTVLEHIPQQSVDCCITSPPFWGLRDYEVAEQIGIERAPEQYVERLCAVIDGVYRVLTQKGTFWLNLGDTFYNCSPIRKSGNESFREEWDRTQARTRGGLRRYPQADQPWGLKMKDLVGIPWRVVFELQKRGWTLRSEIIWNKRSARPEGRGAHDRPSRSHETLFMLVKDRHYFHHKEPLRTVWDLPTSRSKTGHPATFHPELVRPCLSMGCPERGVVLDPFAGSGTVGQVAREMGRSAILIELNPAYCELMKASFSCWNIR